MKNPPGVTFMKEHNGLTYEQKKKSHATYIPTDPKLKAARTGGKWAKTPGLIRKKPNKTWQ